MSRTPLSLAVLFALSPVLPLHAAESADAAAKLQASLGKAGGTQLYYVRHRRGDADGAQRQLDALGGTVHDYLDRISTYVVELPAPAASSLANPAQLTGDSSVVMIEPVPQHRLLEQVVPWNIDQFQARDVWDQDRNGQVDAGAPEMNRVKVCVIDSGIHRSHSDFAGITITGEGEGSVGDWTIDGSGHGTHVAGTVNAMGNSRGVVGVVPGTADLHMVKVFNNSGAWGGGSLASAMAKCRDAGADIINMSLGSESFSTTENVMAQSLYDTHGIVIVAAAGNDGNGVRSYPASYNAVISVGAIDNELQLAADFSQTPPSSYNAATPPANSEWDTVELAGGGVTVLSTIPSPNGEVPRYFAQVGDELFDGARITGHTEPTSPEYMPEGDVAGILVDGGLCLDGSGDPSWSGAVVLCERGGNTAFATKINAVRARGGVAAVIYNNVAGDLSATCASNCATPSIPALSLSQSKGLALRAEAGAMTRVVIDSGDGCVDCSGGYEYMSGTSMASPGVTGALALLWNACGGPGQVSNKTLRRMARETAKDLQGTQPVQNIVYGSGVDRVTGWGLPQVADAMSVASTNYSVNCALNFGVSPGSVELCTTSTTSTQFTTSLSERFQGSATVSVAGSPANASGSFSANPVVHPAKSSVYSLSNLDQAAAGRYPLVFTVRDDHDANVFSTADAELIVRHAAPGVPQTTSPADGAVSVPPVPQLRWQALDGAGDYHVELATDAAFSNVVFSGSTRDTRITTPQLASGTRHYWRVRASNGCGGGAYSNAASFVTGATVTQSMCFETPTPIPDASSSGVTTQLTFPANSGTVLDLDLRFQATHTWTADLIVRLAKQGGPSIAALDRPGYPIDTAGCPANNPQLTLDDEGAGGSAEARCATGNNQPAYDSTLRYTPNEPLSTFDGQELGGVWTVNVSDQVLGDAGSVIRWCVDATVAGAGSGNVPPAFGAASYPFALPAGSANGAVVGTLGASDIDDTTLQFSILSGNAGGAFALDASSGVLSIADAAQLGAAGTVHTLGVQVSDGRGGTATASVAVRVLSADGSILRDGFE